MNGFGVLIHEFGHAALRSLLVPTCTRTEASPPIFVDNHRIWDILPPSSSFPPWDEQPSQGFASWRGISTEQRL